MQNNIAYFAINKQKTFSQQKESMKTSKVKVN